jgi:prophage regulatory protein
MNNDKPQQDVRLLTEKDVEQRKGYKRTWLWAAVKAGAFPRPLKHGRSIRFVAAEVDKWIRDRIADRDGTHTAPRLLFSEREIAAALDVSVSLLQKDRLANAPRFPFMKIVNAVRYDIDEVRAALRAAPVRGQKGDTEQAAT